MNYKELYEYGSDLLGAAGIGEASLDARLLLEYVCHTNRNDLLVHGDRELEKDQETAVMELLQKRAKHIPLQQLTGLQNFMGFDFSVNENVLIPRQDTEILVEEVLLQLHDGMRILDLCTGSGCILISILALSNDCVGVGVDISEKALAVAEKNAEAILADKAKNKVTFIKSDVCAYLEEKVNQEKYEIIVSNPPYIRKDVIPTLMPEVRDYEPVIALDGGEDGLDFYRDIIERAPQLLCGGGILFFEIGHDQMEAVSRLMLDRGFSYVECKKDYAGLDRVVYGTWCNS